MRPVQMGALLEEARVNELAMFPERGALCSRTTRCGGHRRGAAHGGDNLVDPAHHRQLGRVGAGEARLAGSSFAAAAAVRRQEQMKERDNRETRWEGNRK